MMDENLFLCGFMGSGKSTIGRKIASMIGKTFYDLDSVIVEKTKRQITEIFSTFGEAWFRKVERECLLEKLEENKMVMALGGGVLRDQEIIDEIKTHGRLIFLRLTVPHLVARLSRNRRRPLLLNADGTLKSREELTALVRDLYHRRMPQYEQADYIVDIPEDFTPDESARLVLQAVNKEMQRD